MKYKNVSSNSPEGSVYYSLKISVITSVFVMISMIFSTGLSAQTSIYDNAGGNINFGGTGVTILHYPTGSTGKQVGNVVLYKNVRTIGTQVIDCYIRIDSISSGTTITTFDQTAASGSGWTFNAERFFSHFASMPNGTASGYGGGITFSFQFIKGNTFTYNTTTKVPNGTKVSLLNVKINVYDIDGNGDANSNQSARFGRFKTSELNATTNLQATYNVFTGLTSFRSSSSANTVNALDDKNRVRVTYDTISDFRIKLTGGGTMYSFIDFGAGQTYTNPPVLNYQISGNIFNDGNGLSDNQLNGDLISLLDTHNIYVNVIQTGNLVLRSQAINPLGSFVIGAVPAGTYKIILTSTLSTIGSSLTTSSLPENWVSTGEFLGSGSGSDGTVDGILNSIIVTNASIFEANFGVNKRPEAVTVDLTITSPQLNDLIILGTQGTATLSAEDNEDGMLKQGARMAITSLPANGNKLMYNGVEIKFGLDGTTVPTNANPYIIASYDSTQLGVLFAGLNTTTASFNYTVFDNASFKDLTPATYTLNWGNPLPVQFIAIKGSLMENESVQLTWSTASETNNAAFEIERMNDGELEFTTIGELPGGGNSNSVRNYEFVDNSIQWRSEKAYYRIKQIDYDGKFEYSNAVVVVNKASYKVELFPSPTVDFINVRVAYDEPVEIRIVNSNAALVHSETFQDKTVIDLQGLRPGVYYVKLQFGVNLRTHKIVVTE